MCTPFPMIKDKEKLTISHNKIYCDIVSELEAGKNVAMLTIGDPSVYSTYMYIHKRVMQEMCIRDSHGGQEVRNSRKHHGS